MAIKESKYREVFAKVLAIDPELKPVLDYALIKEVVSVEDLMDMASSSDPKLVQAAQNQLIRQHVKNCVDLGYQQYLKSGGSLSDIIQTYLTKLVEVAHSSTRGFSQKLRAALLATEINEPEQVCELSEEIESDQEMEEEMIWGMLKRDLDGILHEHISKREIEVLRYRFGFFDGRMYTLEECANIFGVTRERIRQLEAKALRHIRSRECRKLLRGYVDPDYEPVHFK